MAVHTMFVGGGGDDGSTRIDPWPMMRATTREGVSGASLLGGTRVG